MSVNLDDLDPMSPEYEAAMEARQDAEDAEREGTTAATEQAMSIDVLQEADELFLTSSTRNVHPVVKADARTWQIAGPIGRDLRAAFDERAARDIDP